MRKFTILGTHADPLLTEFLKQFKVAGEAIKFEHTISQTIVWLSYESDLFLLGMEFHKFKIQKLINEL